MVNFVAVERDFVCNRSEFCFFPSPGTIHLRLICFKTVSEGNNGNSEAARDQRTRSSVQDDPRWNPTKEVR